VARCSLTYSLGKILHLPQWKGQACVDLLLRRNGTKAVKAEFNSIQEELWKIKTVTNGVEARHQWLTPIIPPVWEPEIRRIKVSGQLRQKVFEIPSQQKKLGVVL
jgi:hypothetical protein